MQSYVTKPLLFKGRFVKNRGQIDLTCWFSNMTCNFLTFQVTLFHQFLYHFTGVTPNIFFI